MIRPGRKSFSVNQRKYHFSVNQRQYHRISASILLLVFFLPFSAYAAEKQWSGAGDGIYWSDPDNWSPTGVPTASDDVTISLEKTNVYVAETFYAKTITVGGRGEATLTVQNFVYGYVTPDDTSSTALDIRKDGNIIFQGAGDIIVKGKLGTSQQTVVSEPAFMFVVE